MLCHHGVCVGNLSIACFESALVPLLLPLLHVMLCSASNLNQPDGTHSWRRPQQHLQLH
jgi:hypothetical protein